MKKLKLINIKLTDEENPNGDYYIIQNRPVVYFEQIGVTSDNDYDYEAERKDVFNYESLMLTEWFPDKKIKIETPPLRLVLNSNVATKFILKKDDHRAFTIPRENTFIKVEEINDNDYEASLEILENATSVEDILKVEGFDIYVSASSLTEPVIFKMPYINLSPFININNFGEVKIVVQSGAIGQEIYKEQEFIIDQTNTAYIFKTNNTLFFIGSQRPRYIIKDENRKPF